MLSPLKIDIMVLMTGNTENFIHPFIRSLKYPFSAGYMCIFYICVFYTCIFYMCVFYTCIFYTCIFFIFVCAYSYSTNSPYSSQILHIQVFP